MQLFAFLAEAGFLADELTTNATLTFEQVEVTWTITTIQLDLNARVPGIHPTKFQEIATNAKAKCPVPRVLNAEIRLAAKPA